ncbi:MAG: TatD family hydrolase [Neisseriaceae bacterium]
MFVDSHCHLNFPELFNDIDNYLSEMQNNGVDYALCIGTNLDNLDHVVSIANRYNNIFATVGIHPDEGLDSSKFDKNILEKYIFSPKVVGIGETGLDYFHENIDVKLQQDRFKLHIEVAKNANLPLVIHTRNSIEDTLSILREYDVSDSGVVMHCFTENVDNARKCIDMGFYISISGIVTFKNAAVVQETANFVPEDRLLIETDSPFLAPTPFRGKLNHPALVKYTAICLAKLRGITVEKLATITTDNFFHLFKKAQK